MGINWSFVLGGVVVGVNCLVALADPSTSSGCNFLQGGIAWPCLLLVIGFQVVAVAGAFR